MQSTQNMRLEIQFILECHARIRGSRGGQTATITILDPYPWKSQVIWVTTGTVYTN